MAEQAADPPFGTFAPTPLQASIIRAVRGSLFNRGVFRNSVVRLLQTIRPGPIDWEIGRAKFRFHLKDNGTDIALLLKPGFDERELAFLAGGMRQGAFVDVGANIGAYSLLIAAATQDQSPIYALEPLPTLAHRLRFNAEASGFRSIQVLEHAVGEHSGTLTLEQDATNLGATAQSGGAKLVVPVRPLLDALRDANVERVDSLKIDIEGFEDRVLCPFLKGAPPKLRPRRIVLEHIQHRLWAQDCIALAQSSGYSVVGQTRANSLLELSAAGD
jgi:FkbM family methyltransferase